MAGSDHIEARVERGARMLRTALGPAISALLLDPDIVEVMLNPDGRIWVDRLRDGLTDTNQVLSASDGERIIRLVAHHVGTEVHARSPRVSAELPDTGERFEGLLPPVPAGLHRDLVLYGELLGRSGGLGAVPPQKLVVPMLERFLVSDRGFARARRNAGAARRSGD